MAAGTPVKSVEHGSAGFLDFDGVPLWKARANRKHFLWLGHPVAGWAKGKHTSVRRGRSIVAAPDRHMLTLAPTRSGKGTAAIIPNLLTYPGSVFVIDPKGENAWVTAARRRQMGQQVLILDPWNEVSKRYGPETNARFNPMAGLDPISADFTDDLAGLADALIINQGKDPHWDDSARELIAGLIAFLVEDPATRDGATLGQVRQLLTLPRAQIVALIRQAVERGGVAGRKLARFGQDTNEISSIISTATTQTAFLDNDALNAAMSVSDIDFARLAEGNVSIYVVIPADKLGPYGRWLRLLVTIAIRELARAQRPKSKVLFLLDEFGTIGRLAAVEQAFGLMGGMGICLWPFVQDLNQLKRDYPESWETFIANAEAVQAFGVKDNFSSDYLSRLLGVATEEAISEETAEMRRGSLFRLAEPERRAMQDRTFQRSLMFADEIRALRPDWQLIIYRGKPVMAALMPYYTTSAFNGMYRPLPGFAANRVCRPCPI
ncbi:MAG: TraM recognition domain-containing protein [Alphaproteobacteria bacterium]|nr:TraM recognition domain-containing protein [Alphaproteobacteria bacterium]